MALRINAVCAARSEEAVSGRGRMRGARKSRSGVGVRAAFSLIEVLIAVVVLALGLLGVGAIFPVVIRQQADGVTAMAGQAAGRSVDDMLLARFKAVREAVGEHAAGGGKFDLPRDGEWAALPVVQETGYAQLGESGAKLMPMAVGNRLFPDWSSGSDPRFVWDLALRRLSPNSKDVEVAVFVREVSTGIRVPRGETLRRVLTGGVAKRDARLPVSVDPGTGLVRSDGTGVYAAPITIEVETREDGLTDLDRIYLDGNKNLWPLAARVGQTLVDNLGNVYTVRDSGKENGDEYVKVSPRPPAKMKGATEDQSVHQVVLTPQSPVNVFTFRVRGEE